MYNDKLVYKVVISMVCGISLWKEKESLKAMHHLALCRPAWLPSF